MRRMRKKAPPGTARRPLLIAHRGSSGTAPENTLAAFRKAVASGAAMIELDARLSLDGELIVLHDRRVNRTTGGRGRVRDLTLEEIRALDAGSWFGAAFRGEPIPVLRELFSALPVSVALNIEVKTDGDRRRNALMARTLCRFLHAARGRRGVLVSSFDRAFLKRMRSVCPAVPLGLLSTPVRDMGRKPSSLCRSVGATTFICSRRQLRKRYVADARANDLALFVYGVNRPAQLAQALRAGVDGVMTDFPELLRHRIPCP